MRRRGGFSVIAHRVNTPDEIVARRPALDDHLQAV